MKKLGRLLTFIGVSGAALAGLWYFIDTTKKARECEECSKEDNEEATPEVEPHSYVSLDPEDITVSEEDKESLKKNVASAVTETIAKAEEAADGVGVVKEDTKTSDFAFESFDEKKED